jgi:hypothetical protein
MMGNEQHLSASYINYFGEINVSFGVGQNTLRLEKPESALGR